MKKNSYIKSTKWITCATFATGFWEKVKWGVRYIIGPRTPTTVGTSMHALRQCLWPFIKRVMVINYIKLIWCHQQQPLSQLYLEKCRLPTVLISESSTLTANAVPQANGCVMYSSVSGSSSSSWSRNCTLASLAGQTDTDSDVYADTQTDNTFTHLHMLDTLKSPPHWRRSRSRQKLTATFCRLRIRRQRARAIRPTRRL